MANNKGDEKSPSTQKLSGNMKVRLNCKCYMNDHRKILGSKFPFLTKIQIQKRVSQTWSKLSKEEQEEYDGTMIRTPCKSSFTEKLRMQKSPAVCTRSKFSKLKSPPPAPVTPISPAALATYDFDDDGIGSDEDNSFRSSKKTFASGCKWNFKAAEIPSIIPECKTGGNGILKSTKKDSTKKAKTLRARRRVSFVELDNETPNGKMERTRTNTPLISKKSPQTRNKRKLEFDCEPRKSPRLTSQHSVKLGTFENFCIQDELLSPCEVKVGSVASNEKHLPLKKLSSYLSEKRSPIHESLEQPPKNRLKALSKNGKIQSRKEKSAQNGELFKSKGRCLRSTSCVENEKNMDKSHCNIQAEVNASGDAKIFKRSPQEAVIQNASVLPNDVDLSDDDEKDMHLALLYGNTQDFPQSSTSKTPVNDPPEIHEQDELDIEDALSETSKSKQHTSKRNNNWSYVTFSKNCTDNDDLLTEDASNINNCLPMFEDLIHVDKSIVKKPCEKNKRIFARTKRQDTPAKRRATPKPKKKKSVANYKTTRQSKLSDYLRAEDCVGKCNKNQSPDEVVERASKLQQLKKKMSMGNCKPQKDMFGFNDSSGDSVEESDRDESPNIISKSSAGEHWFYDDIWRANDQNSAKLVVKTNSNPVMDSSNTKTSDISLEANKDEENNQEPLISDSSQTVEKIIVNMKKITNNGINPEEILLEKEDIESIGSDSPHNSSSTTVEKIIKSMQKITDRHSQESVRYEDPLYDIDESSQNSAESIRGDGLESHGNNPIQDNLQSIPTEVEDFSLEKLFDDIKPNRGRRKRALSSKGKKTESNFAQMFDTEDGIFM